MKNQIARLLAKTPTMPILFVGSGLTRRYLNLPSWEMLLRQFCISKPFELYYLQAEKEVSDDEMLFPHIADLIEADYNEKWFTNEAFELNREKHKELIAQKISPFKIEIADFFATSGTETVDGYEEEIEKFARIGEKNIACILTTNYDCFLEKTFGENSFKTYIGQNDLLFSTTYEIGELYKIHGCCTRPESIVINEGDYRKFIQKRSYLSAKIMTMFLERPIIFIGYSITDANIKRILASVSECLENDQLDKLKERLIFVEWNNSEDRKDGLSERRLDFGNGKTITMNNLLLSNYSVLYDAILENTVKYDVRILRRIKSQLYELVKDNKPNEKLHVISDIEDDQADIDFVVGVGAYGKLGDVGYSGIKSEEVFLYALGQANSIYNVDMLLKETIPTVHNGGRGNFPVCQFISKCQSLECLNDRVKLLKKNDFSDFYTETDKAYLRKNGYIAIPSILEYYHNYGLDQILSRIPRMDPILIEPDELYDLLIKALNDHPELLDPAQRAHTGISRSLYKKCISIWDWLTYNNSANRRIAELSSKNKE